MYITIESKSQKKILTNNWLEQYNSQLKRKMPIAGPSLDKLALVLQGIENEDNSKFLQTLPKGLNPICLIKLEIKMPKSRYIGKNLLLYNDDKNKR